LEAADGAGVARPDRLDAGSGVDAAGQFEEELARLLGDGIEERAVGARGDVAALGDVGSVASPEASRKMTRYQRLGAVPFSVVNERSAGVVGSASTGSRLMVSMVVHEPRADDDSWICT
jgi:hypothetical protein